jgi:hypothetical protein
MISSNSRFPVEYLHNPIRDAGVNSRNYAWKSVWEAQVLWDGEFRCVLEGAELKLNL